MRSLVAATSVQARHKKTGGPLARTAGNQTQFRRALAVKQNAFRQIDVGRLLLLHVEKAEGNTEQ